MKKTKKFTKAHLTLAIMVIALAAAVGLNMKYSADMGNSDTSSKYLGQAEYVNASAEEESDQSKESDYFKNLRKERKSARDEALDIIEETLDRTDLTENERKEAVEKSKALADAAEREATIETLLKAKGFSSVLAVIGEKDINIIVDKAPDQTGITRIQDAVLSQTSFTVADIKIIAAEENS